MLKEFLEHNNPCDICLDEKCGGKHTCNCSTCKMLADCPKFLRAVIRITNKCTQTCSHCCFKSSPKSNIMMNIEMAKDVATFIKSNKVCDLNVMGGEFFCNPYWYEILSILVDSTHSMRLVTNGDWVIDNEIADKVVEFINLNKPKLKIAISKDKWHTNKNIEKAEEYIKQTGALYHVALPSETTDSSIVPIGRSEFEYTPLYSFAGCYCHNPYEQYTFLIDENGDSLLVDLQTERMIRFVDVLNEDKNIASMQLRTYNQLETYHFVTSTKYKVSNKIEADFNKWFKRIDELKERN